MLFPLSLSLLALVVEGAIFSDDQCATVYSTANDGSAPAETYVYSAAIYTLVGIRGGAVPLRPPYTAGNTKAEDHTQNPLEPLPSTHEPAIPTLPFNSASPNALVSTAHAVAPASSPAMKPPAIQSTPIPNLLTTQVMPIATSTPINIDMPPVSSPAVLEPSSPPAPALSSAHVFMPLTSDQPLTPTTTPIPPPNPPMPQSSTHPAASPSPPTPAPPIQPYGFPDCAQTKGSPPNQWNHIYFGDGYTEAQINPGNPNNLAPWSSTSSTLPLSFSIENTCYVVDQCILAATGSGSKSLALYYYATSPTEGYWTCTGYKGTVGSGSYFTVVNSAVGVAFGYDLVPPV